MENSNKPVNDCHMWKGRPMTELSRDELLEVIDWCAEEMQGLRKDRDRWFQAGDPLKYLMQVSR